MRHIMYSTRGLGWVAVWGMVLTCPVARASNMGTAFTYQGYLEKPVGTPVSGVNCDFRFGLWDTAAVGNQKGTSPQSKTGVVVTDGVFT